MPRLPMSFALFAVVGVAGCVGAAVAVDDPTAVRGENLAQAHCAQCHAIAETDESARADAPPLRDLYRRYPNDDLRRAVREGIHIGHEDMPVFRLGEVEADALAAYLWTLNPCARPSADTAAMERCFSRL